MLIRRFSPLSLLMISINGMVGSAWLFAPLYSAKIAGPLSLVAWVIGGVMTIVIALTFAELAVLFPIAGGTAQIPQKSHGVTTSFIISWVGWLSALTMAPIEVQAILQYASTYFTSLIHVNEIGVPLLTERGLLCAFLLMIMFCVINVVSYKGLVRFNFLLFTFKILVILTVIGMLFQRHFDTQNFSLSRYPLTDYATLKAILTALTAGGIAFAFTGFKHGVELAGEATSLKISLPLAIIGSVGVCLLLYLGLQLVFIGALRNSMLANGWSHLSFVGDIGPFAGLIASVGVVWLVKLLYIDAVVSPMGAGLIYVTSTARILYAMGEIGYLPKALTYVNRENFPVIAIIINFVLGMLLFLPLPGWQAMVSFLVSGMVVAYAIGPIALICLRYELPHATREFRLPCAFLICPVAFYFCNLLIYWSGWLTIYKLSIAIIVGAILFFLYQIKKGVAFNSLNLKSSWWLLPYLGGIILISYLGQFEGRNIIKFGWDFAILAVFSGFIFYLAIKNRLGTEKNLAYTQKLEFDMT